MTVSLRTSLNTGLNSGLRQSISGGAGAKSFTGSTLDLDFAGAKSLKNQIGKKDLVTFSRASSATFVDGDGLIKTTPVNLLIYSEEFDNSSWTKSSGATVNLNAVAAPDGTNTASIVNFSGSSSRFFQTKTLTAGTYTLSAFLRVSSGSKALTMQVFNSTDGSQNKNITVTDSWQRFTHTVTVSGAVCQLHPVRPDDLGDVYVWGAQLEEGSTATDYIPTTNTISGAPRFDHDPATGESLGLLIEEARTNSLPYSDFSLGFQLDGVTRSNSTELNPEGVASCVRLIAASNSSPHRFRRPGGIAGDATVSCFVKMDTHRYVTVGWGGVINNFSAVFDIHPDVTGDRLLSQSGLGTFTNIDAGYENYPNGWVRIFASGTTSATGGWAVSIARDENVLKMQNWPAVGTEAIFVWGPQWEDGKTFPTSYIPTDGSAVTRAADNAEITGADFAKTNLLQYSERFDDATWVKERTVITPNVISAPDGSTTADLLVEDTATGTHSCKQTESLTSGTSYVFSAHVKANSLDHVFLDIYDTSFTTKAATFDLTAVTSADATGSPTSHSIVDIGDGWYRVSMVFTAPSTSSHTIEIRLSKDGNWVNRSYTGTGESLYVWGAQLEEGDFLTDYTPSVETFVSRASSATYVDDATGLIKTTPVNLSLYSNSYQSFGLNVITNPAPTDNTQIAPDGTQSAWQMPTSATSFLQRNYVIEAGKTYTFSFHVKQGAGTRVATGTMGVNGDDTIAGVIYNFSTEELANGWVKQDLNNGWLRLSRSFVSSTSTLFIQRLDLSHSSQNATGYFVWGAQLEEGTTATSYIKTTSTISGAARFEDGELILEEARTNTVLYSDMSATSPWFTTFDGTVTEVSGLPGPFDTATLFEVDATGSFQVKGGSNLTNFGGSFELGSRVSVYTKLEADPTGTSTIFIQNGSANSRIVFTFATETVSTSGTQWANPSFERLAGGWYRISGDYINTTIGDRPRVYISDRPNSFQVNTPGTKVYLKGFQSEVGSYATSWIPTEASTATRAADVSTSALGVDSFYNQSEGTVFVDAETPNQTNIVVASLSNGTNNNKIEVRSSGTGLTQARAVIRANATTTFDKSPTASTGTFRRLALAYKATDSKFATSKSLSNTETSVTIPSVNRLYLGNEYNQTDRRPGHIKRLSYFPTRLPNATLQSITS